MNLEDVIDPEYGLQQDEWSLSRPKFGKEGQLEVIGWSGKQGTNKFYLLKCNKCADDAELFGDGYFKSKKCHLDRGHIPCSCSHSFRWSKDQYEILCIRKAKKIGYTFLGFGSEWRNKNTKVDLFCEKHGTWSSSIISTLVNKGYGCPGCRVVTTTKEDDVMISSFLSSGGFHPDTTFWRSDRRTRQGKKTFWVVDCPECGARGEARSGDLQKGSRPCLCSKQRQQECYINWLINDDKMVVAIKFGIAQDSKQRIKNQERYSVHTLKQHSIYTFPDVQSCKTAERECKQTLECGVLSKEEMPDGYTETTSVLNLGRIKRIYEKHGGVLNK